MVVMLSDINESNRPMLDPDFCDINEKLMCIKKACSS
jgi:hypothetical protein